MGYQLALGDITGDGVAELVVSSGNSSVDGQSSTGEVYVFDGPLSSDTPTSAAVGTLQGDTTVVGGDGLGTNTNWLGDTDGDGYGEFGLGSKGGPGLLPIGHTYLFNGPVTGTLRALDRADTFFSGVQVGDTASYVTSAGDLDQDGLDDVALGAVAIDGDARGGVLLHYGPVPRGSFLITDSPDAILWGEAGLPVSISASSDIDGDCMPDLVVGPRVASM